MRRWTRIGIIAVMIPVLLLAATGVYALVGLRGSDDGPPLPGFALARPLFAQTDPAAFPVDDAGISAYVQVDSSKVDFDKITPIFDGAVDAGDNYVIGTISLEQGLWHSRMIGVNVYVDTEGWIVAYLTLSTPLANVFTWNQWISGSELNTTLVEALEETAAAIAVFIDPTAVGWYYWANPDATHFAAAARAGTGSMFVAIPAGATVYGKPSYSWDSSSTYNLFLTKLGAPPLQLPASNAFRLNEVDMDKGAMYTFEAGVGQGASTETRLGVSVVYKAAP